MLEVSPEIKKCCLRCKESKPISSFSPRKQSPDGHAIYCHKCCRWFNKHWRESEHGRQVLLDGVTRWRKTEKGKLAAKKAHKKARESGTTKIQWAAYYALQTGRLIPPEDNKCEVCKIADWQDMHHPSYNKPYYVAFICKRCHGNVHKGGDSR